MTGLDETSSQTLHAQARYEHKQLAWGVRYADLLTELPDGRVRVDLTKFQSVVETAPTEDFPYPRHAKEEERELQEVGKTGS